MSLLSPSVSQDAARRTQPAQLWRRLLPALALGLGPLTLALLKLEPALDLRFESAVGHFWIVTVAALVAVGLALLILRAAVSRRDGRVLLIGSAFLGISSIFLIHAVATPGVLFHDTGHATSWSTPIALAVGAALLMLSASERFAQQPWLIRRWRALLLGGGLIWALYSGFMLAYVPARSAADAAHHAAASEAAEYSSAASPVAAAEPITLQAWLLAIRTTAFVPLYSVVVLLYLAAALCYGWHYYRAPTRPLAALACGSVLLAETSLAAYTGSTWHLSFWLYHVLLLAAVITVSSGVLSSYQRGGALSSAVSGWLLRSTLQRQQAATQHAMTILLDVLEHGRAETSPQLRAELRQRLGLADDQLDLLEHTARVVAQERQEQQRLRGLADVSRAATLALDPDLLLRNAVTIFGQSTDVGLCLVGLIDDEQLTFKPEHCFVRGQTLTETLRLSLSAVPAVVIEAEGALHVAPLSEVFAPLGLVGQRALQLPLLHHGRVLGVLLVQPQPSAAIDERLIAVCRSLSSQLASALANARLYQELQRKHEHLLRSEQAREQLTQMVVHDLKNPLTAIRGYHTLLRMTTLTDEQQELLAGAHRSTSTMIQLISDILDIARLEEGRLELRPTPIDVAALFADARAELHSWAEQEQQPIRIAVPAELPRLLLDASLLERVLINLLSNAIKHTPRGTAITLGARLDADAVRLWVEDRGPGIAPEQAQQLFERFSAGPASSEQQSNTGLGLTFCKLVVEAHAGTIAVASTPGQGSTFTISLPLSVVAPEAG